MYKHILLPTNGTERGLRATKSGIELARTLNAEVTGLFVSERAYIPAADEGPKPQAEEALAMVAELAKAAGIKYSGFQPWEIPRRKKSPAVPKTGVVT
jgi:nucleotide-binding universal stress UspA family protein